MDLGGVVEGIRGAMAGEDWEGESESGEADLQRGETVEDLERLWGRGCAGITRDLVTLVWTLFDAVSHAKLTMFNV